MSRKTNAGAMQAGADGRNAYLSAFHAARAFISERTAKITKTHAGIHTEFARLAKDEPNIDKGFPVFLIQAYNLKSVAGSELGPRAVILPERAAAAIETATRFVASISTVLAPPFS